MGGFPDIPNLGSTSDYFNQGGSGADVPGGGGFGGFNLGGGGDPLGGLDQGPGGEIGQGLAAIAPFTGPAAPFVAAAAALAEIGQSIANAVASTGIPSTELSKDVGNFFASSSDWRVRLVDNYVSYLSSHGQQYTSPARPGGNFTAFIGLIMYLFGPWPNNGSVIHITVPGKTKPVSIGIPKYEGPKSDFIKTFYNAMGVNLPTNFEAGNLYLVKFIAATGALNPHSAKLLVGQRGQAIASVVDTLLHKGDIPETIAFLRNVWKVGTIDLQKATGGDFKTTNDLSDLCPCGNCDSAETIRNWTETDPYGDPVGDAFNAIEQEAGVQPDMAGGLSNQLGALPTDGGGGSNSNTNTASTGPVNVTIDESGLAAALVAAEQQNAGGLTMTDWILIGAGFLVLLMVIVK